MSLDRPNRRDKTQADQIEQVADSWNIARKYGRTLALSALIFSVDSAEEKIEAAEIEPQMSWSEGLAALRDDVFNALAEQGTVAVQLGNGKVFWVTSRKEDRGIRSMEVRPAEIRTIIESQASISDVDKA